MPLQIYRYIMTEPLGHQIYNDSMSHSRLYQCSNIVSFHEPLVAQVAQNSSGSNTFG